MQDVAMELLIKALAEMKTKDANKQIEQYLMQQLNKSKIQSSGIQQNGFILPQTTHPTITSSQIPLQINESQQNDFDTTLTNDFDSTLFSTINNIQQEMQKREQNILNDFPKQSDQQQQNNGKQNSSSKKLINFRQKALQQDEVILENVNAVVTGSQKSEQPKKYTFKQYVQETEEPIQKPPTQKYEIKQNYNQQTQPEQKTDYKEQKQYVLKKPNIRQNVEPKKTKKPEKKVQQETKQIIQIVHLPQKQVKQSRQQPAQQKMPKQKTKVKNDDSRSPMIIKEQIIKKKVQSQPKKQDKMELAMDIAALVAAEYEKQIQKFNEEEGNKSVKSQELRELSMLINNQQPQQPITTQKQQKREKQPKIQKSITESVPSTISDGEIWPKYDINGAQILQQKGRGIGAWDRSITTDWLEPQNDELSEGEIHIYNKLIDSLNDFY